VFDRQRMRKWAQRIRPLLVPLILYLGLLALAVVWVPKMEISPWRYAVAVLPMVPGLFLASGIVRASSRLDEMENRILLEAVAFSFISTLILLLSFGLLGLTGVTQPRPIHTVSIMCGLLVIGKLWGNWRYR
jgi:hypothetical protein